MPVPNNRASLKEFWRLGTNPDQDHGDGHDQKRCHRVHHNAKWALIGGVRGRMRISRMDQCKQHQPCKSTPQAPSAKCVTLDGDRSDGLTVLPSTWRPEQDSTQNRHLQERLTRPLRLGTDTQTHNELSPLKFNKSFNLQ